MKNTVYAIIIVVCLTLTGITVFVTRSASRNVGVPSSMQTWVTCLSCGDARQMSLKNFWKQERATMAHEEGVPDLKCPKCGKSAVVEAFKCPKCNTVTPRRNAAPSPYDDCCPKCGFSQLEADAKAKADPNHS
jgi:hypothetical protein